MKKGTKKRQYTVRGAYELWYECLKLNPDYQEYCKLRRELRKAKTQSEAMKSLFEKDIKGGGFLLKTFRIFGEVSKVPFEKWWTASGKNLSSSPQDKTLPSGMFSSRAKPKPIEDYRDLFYQDAFFCIQDFKRRNKREPSLKEFLRAFVFWLYQSKNTSEILRVTLLHTSTEKILSELTTLIRKRKQDARTLEKRYPLETWVSDGDLHPIEKTDLAICRRAISIYREKERKSWADIVPKNAGDIRTYKRDLQTAKSLIARATTLNFP